MSITIFVLALFLKPVTVHGSVLDLDQHPLAGARVWLLRETGTAFDLAEPPSASTRPDGRFTLRAAGGRYALVARAAGHREFYVPGITVPGIAVPGFAFHPDGGDLGTVILEPAEELRGRVVDPAGAGVAEAEVRMSIPGRTQRDQIQITDVEGFFRFESPPTSDDLRFVVRHELHRDRILEGISTACSGLLQLVLEPAAAIDGRLLDEAEEPVAGAVVELVSRQLAARTDAAGRFQFSRLAPGRVVLEVRGEGAASEPLELDLRVGERAEALLRWRPGERIAGYVFDPDQVPVAGARIRVEPDRPGSIDEGELAAAYDHSALADEAGRFELGGLVEQRYRIAAHHDDFLPVREVIEVGAKTFNEVEIAFAERRENDAPRLDGRVLDSRGQAVAEARLRLLSARGLPAATASSDERGAFLLRPPGPGDYVVEARHPRFALYRGEPVRLEASREASLELRLETAGAIAGEVHGVEADRLAELRLTATSSRGALIEGQIRHDASYRVAGVASGDWRVEAHLGGRRATGTARVDGGETRLDLRFTAGSRLTGRLSRQGEPLTGARITVQCGDDFHDATSSDAAGGFELRDVPDGPCGLTVTDRRGAGLARRQAEVRGDTEIFIDLDARALAGRVIEARGHAPVEGARISILEPSSLVPEATVRSDAAGRFELAGISDGERIVRVMKGGYGGVEWRVRPGAASDLEIPLQPATPLILRIADRHAVVPDSVRLEIANGAGAVFYSGIHRPELDGRVVVDALSAGHWRLTASAPGGVAEMEFQLPAGPQLSAEPVRIVLDPVVDLLAGGDS